MAFSAIENRYLDMLTEREYPTLDPMQAAEASGEMQDGMPIQVADASGGLPEMRAYDPTVRQKLAASLQTVFEQFGMDRFTARKRAQTIIGGPSSNLPLEIGIADVVPFVGTGLQTQEAVRMGEDAVRSAQRGDYGTAAVQAGGAALGMVPGALGTAKAAVAAGRSLGPKAADMAEGYLSKTGQLLYIAERTAENSPWLSREEFTAYQNQPMQLKGFASSGQNKGFDEQNYRHAEFLEVKLNDGTTFYDAIRGLNKPHALSRAFGNWPAATEIRTLTRREAEKADPSLVKEVDAAMSKSTGKQSSRQVKKAPASDTSTVAERPQDGMQERAVRADTGSPEPTQSALKAGSNDYLSTLRKNDVFGDGRSVEYYDDERGVMYSMRLYPAGERWTAWDVFPKDDGGNQVIGEFEKHKSFADAVKSVKGARISAAIKSKNSKYADIPNTWNGDAKKLAKALIDAGVQIERFASSTQSNSKYLYLADGRKIRLADHDLPLAYESADFDYRYGDEIKDLVSSIAEREQN